MRKSHTGRLRKLRASRLVIWAMHGVIGVGKTLDDAFGLIETAEKAAETYFKISGFAEKRESPMSS